MKLVYADLNKYDHQSRVILTTIGTRRDLEKHNIVLEDGLALTFYMDDADDQGNEDNIIFDGVVRYDEENARWVAAIDWENFRHESDLRASIDPEDKSS